MTNALVHSPLYSYLKLLHIISVMLFFGSIALGQFWLAHAHRTREPRLIEHAIDGVLRSTQLITMPTVATIVIFGWATAWNAGISVLHTPWISIAIGMFAISGGIFVGVLEPNLKRLRVIVGAANRNANADVSTNDNANSGVDWSKYESIYQQFKIWSTVGLVTPIVSIVLMVLKPGA